MTDRVGQYIGNYQLTKLLGQGGCAEVYLGKHRHLNSYAALKVLNTETEFSFEDIHTFLAEAQTLANLRHPNIIHLLDFSIENGPPVLIMDYAPKGSLRQRYPQGTKIPLTTVVDYVTQIATALQYAHNHNVIHRDVKPENILLDANNQLLLSDFGLSLLTLLSQSISTQAPVGTPRYMAPEQLRGKPCFASDQYALAVMVYEWLCGKHPFQGTMWEVWQHHLYTAPPPLRTIRPELPVKLEQVVHRALAKKHEDRFVSIQAFALALARVSQTDTPVDENGKQSTDRLPPLRRSSPITHHSFPLLPQLNKIAQIPTRVIAEVTPQPALPLTLQNQNRTRMLRRLRRSYNDLISQSLQGASWLELGIASKPDAVQNATSLLLHVTNRTGQHLPPGTSIIQAYDNAEHELLILGDPGAGKSTLLLELAQQLTKRAEQDETHPLPVILPLSSWAIKRPPLQDWIADQLAEIYDVPRTLSVQWARGDDILPLLDGLDEMEETARAACIAAINTYHREHMAPLVVCSRTTEYEIAAATHRLLLQGAIVVQPLTKEDVDTYLVRAGKSLTALQSALKNNVALHDLATTPLMLNILILTYQGASTLDLSKRESLLLQQVWDDYIRRMVERKGNSKRYPLERTRAYLSWLARQMREHNQTLFYLEHLQPDWLSVKQQRAYEWRTVRLPAIVIGILMSFLVSVLFFGYNGYNKSLVTDLNYGIVGGFLGILAHRPKRDQEVRRGLWVKRLITRFAISACFGLIIGFSLGFYMSLLNYTLNQQQTTGLSLGIVTVLSTLLLQYILQAPSSSGQSSGNSARGLWTRLVRFFQSVQGRALQVSLIFMLNDVLIIEPILGPGISLSLGLSYGLIYALISLALNTQMEDIRPAERLNWTWRSLRRGLFNARHLQITLLLTCISIICVGVRFGPNIGVGRGLSTGLSYWCLLGLFQGIAQQRIDNQDRRIANQGIHRSWRNSLIISIISGVVIGSMGTLTYWWAFWLITTLDHVLGHERSSRPQYDALNSVSGYILSTGLQLCISGALLIFLLTGGLAVLRHYTIRLLLWRSHTFPWRAPQFLDDAVARFLLRRVGGGYSFTHRLLLDHLADAEKE